MSPKKQAGRSNPPEDPLVELWTLGKLLRTKFTRLARRKVDPYRHGNKGKHLAQEANQPGRNQDRLRKSIKFAEEHNKAEVEAWCQAIKRHESSFGVAHIQRCLAIDKKTRSTFICDAIAKGWSTHDIDLEVKGHLGRRPAVGRKPSVPEGEIPRLLMLDDLALRFIRWCERGEQRLPEKVCAKAQVCRKSLEMLRTAIEAAIANSKRTKKAKRGKD